MFRVRPSFRVALHLICGLRIAAQTGDAVHVPFECREEELQRAGMDCSEAMPCAIFLELTAIATSGRNLLIAGNLHSGSTTLDSVLLESANDGATWKETAVRVPGATLDLVQVYDRSHAWAAGETQDPLPRDPFFLVTTSGGDSWRNRPVRDSSAPGSVLSFQFDSPEHGDLLIDAGNTAPGGRYLSYESQTGGESWMLRGTATQLPEAPSPRATRARASPTGDIDWRIRAGDDGKSWLAEKRTGEQWIAAASFLIDAANCAGVAGSDHVAGPDNKDK